MSLVLDVFTIVMVSLGGLFFLGGTLGLLRFPDTLSRLHALTKADNLGLGLVVLGLLPRADWPLGALQLIAVWLLAMLSGAVVGQFIGAAVRPADWQAGRVAARQQDQRP